MLLGGAPACEISCYSAKVGFNLARPGERERTQSLRRGQSLFLWKTMLQLGLAALAAEPSCGWDSKLLAGLHFFTALSEFLVRETTRTGGTLLH